MSSSGFHGYLHSCASMPQRHIKKFITLGMLAIVHRLKSHMVPVAITTSKVQERKILPLQKVLWDKTAMHQQHSETVVGGAGHSLGGTRFPTGPPTNPGASDSSPLLFLRDGCSWIGPMSGPFLSVPSSVGTSRKLILPRSCAKERQSGGRAVWKEGILGNWSFCKFYKGHLAWW